MPTTRRQLLKASAGAALAYESFSSSVLRALAAPAVAGRLTDIEHVVFVMQENRSFDHYFGTYPGVRGFSDPSALPGVFEQSFAANKSVAPVGKVLPYRLAQQCTPDPTHSFGDQHTAWDGGAMDGWGRAHAGDADWSFMGYYTRDDVPYFHAVADAFTLCDAYHSSVMGSTTGNRCYAMTGMFDAAGRYGGPVFSTKTWDPTSPPPFSEQWITYPEVLFDAGVDWRCYMTVDGDYEENPLVQFPQYYPQYASDPQRAAQLGARLFGASFETFLADAAAGNLPQVSWVLDHITQMEHPAAAPQDGESALELIVDAVTANPLTWPKTVVFFMYDENGGYFDHLCPPTAPAGTPGEFAKGAESQPIGLGFRVPMLIVSPFSRGGFVARDTYDHTSQLLFLERWLQARGVEGVTAPNVTDWRRATVGDLTTALNFAGPDTTVPSLAPRTPMNPAEHPECATEEVTMAASPTPTQQALPSQEPGTRPSPSGPVS